MNRYAVIGNPVAHSKSPEIHAAFAKALGQALTYERVLSPLDKFPETVAFFRDQGGSGCNITIPFKQAAFMFATTHTPRAQLAGVVNTLRFDGDTILGDNTDGIGLARDLETNLHFSLDGKRLLILGAGGGAQGALGELLRLRPASVAIHNRTHAKAVAVANHFNEMSVRGHNLVLLAIEDAQLHRQQFDLIINATATSLQGEMLTLPSSIFAPDALAYDMMYGVGLSPFLQFARDAGATVTDGLGMLVEQAAEAFFIWRGVRPNTSPVLANLKNSR